MRQTRAPSRIFESITNHIDETPLRGTGRQEVTTSDRSLQSTRDPNRQLHMQVKQFVPFQDKLGQRPQSTLKRKTRDYSAETGETPFAFGLDQFGPAVNTRSQYVVNADRTETLLSKSGAALMQGGIVTPVRERNPGARVRQASRAVTLGGRSNGGIEASFLINAFDEDGGINDKTTIGSATMDRESRAKSKYQREQCSKKVDRSVPLDCRITKRMDDNTMDSAWFTEQAPYTGNSSHTRGRAGAFTNMKYEDMDYNVANKDYRVEIDLSNRAIHNDNRKSRPSIELPPQSVDSRRALIEEDFRTGVTHAADAMTRGHVPGGKANVKTQSTIMSNPLMRAAVAHATMGSKTRKTEVFSSTHTTVPAPNAARQSCSGQALAPSVRMARENLGASILGREKVSNRLRFN